MAQTMKALVKREPGKGIWMEDVPVPVPGANEVLIKVEKTAICGSCCGTHIPSPADAAPMHAESASARTLTE